MPWSAQLDNSADTMNSQADEIESWISNASEASVDASSVEAGISSVSGSLGGSRSCTEQY